MKDEPPRPQITLSGLARLRPVFADTDGATITAGNSSPLADGAAALLLCRADIAKSLGECVNLFRHDC